jgi:hypothetical protein
LHDIQPAPDIERRRVDAASGRIGGQIAFPPVADLGGDLPDRAAGGPLHPGRLGFGGGDPNETAHLGPEQTPGTERLIGLRKLIQGTAHGEVLAGR